MTEKTDVQEVFKYVFNKTNSILLIQNNDNSILVKLEPHKCSTQPFAISKLEKISHIKKLLVLDKISLSDDYLITEDIIGEDYGQEFKLGNEYILKGTHKLKVKLLKYDPSTKTYTCKNVLTNAIIKVIANDIDEKATLEENKSEDVEIVRQTEDEEIMERSAQEVINNEKSVEDVEPEVIRTNGSKLEEEENEIIVRSASEPFAKEVSVSKINQDTSKLVTEKLKDAMGDVIVKKATLKAQDFKDFPEIYKEWFAEFKAKDERKQKMTIAVCNDKEKLNLLIKYGDEYVKTLAETRLQKLIEKEK